tara:strand:+ start:3465 stop:11732 length:8268 start_codon:yes stop_codon:yes gene_type:complete
MPEIKNTFTQGKMNKDLDERIIPNGEYREALNVKVTSSDDASVGVVQNILGNIRVDSHVPTDYVCIATITDDKNDNIYWFVTRKDPQENDNIHAILQHSARTNITKYVVVDIYDNTLKFTNKIITGINIIDDFLFWTDNNSEPKKIHIPSCIEGTDQSLGLNAHTNLYIDGVSQGDLHEDNITVIRKSPKSQPIININEPTSTNKDPLFEKVFPRFSFRYKYKDGEYSTFGPFTNVVFNPIYTEDYSDSNAYSDKEGYNTAMVNSIESIEISGFKSDDLPNDVVQVEILYKEDGSTVVFSIKKINNNDPEWTSNSYTITSESIFAALPENQLLRPWDNVPKKALAQEVTGNRIVYGNYTQNYDLIAGDGSKILNKITAGYNLKDHDKDIGLTGVPSIKSQRKYQLGLVWGDKYGRETPVFVNDEGGVNVGWYDSNFGLLASKSLGLNLTIDSKYPSWAEYYKVYVKETSGEYYNLLMSKAYAQKDINVFDDKKDKLWLAFPSSDRNKITEESFLILKKKIGGTEGQIQLKNKFKVLDVQNEAPDAIKFEYLNLGSATQTTDGSNPGDFLHGGTTDGLMNGDPENQITGAGNTIIHIRRSAWVNQVGGSLTQGGNNEEMYVENIYMSWSTPDRHSEKYKVVSIVFFDPFYMCTLSKGITTEDAAIALGTATGVNLSDDLVFRCERREEKKLDEFSGKFFAQIVSSGAVAPEVSDEDLLENYVISNEAKINWFYNEEATNGNEGNSGLVNITPGTPAPESTQYAHDAAGHSTPASNPLTKTESDWQTLAEDLNSETKRGFFIDNMYMASGQINPPNNSLAKTSGEIWIGTRWSANSMSKAPLWIEEKTLNPTTNQYEGTGVYGWGAETWSPTSQFMLLQVGSYSPRPWRDQLSTGPSYNTYLKSSGIQNFYNNYHINGLEGFLTTTPTHTGIIVAGQLGVNGTTTENNGGRKKWRNISNDSQQPFTGPPETTYGNESGKFYVHLSFLGPGEDLHDGDWDSTGLPAYNTTTQFGKDSFANHLQGIWGGGVFNNPHATPPTTVEMEGNYDDGNVALPFPPESGVGQGYDSNYQDRHENQWNPSWPASKDPDGKIAKFLQNLTVGQKFKFSSDDDTVFTILTEPIKKHLYNHTPWVARWEYNGTDIVYGGDSVDEKVLTWAEDKTSNNFTNARNAIVNFGKANNRRICYIFEVNKDPVSTDAIDITATDNLDVDSQLDFQFMSNNQNVLLSQIVSQPAIWETEPKENFDLDIYYEASSAYPTKLTEKTRELIAPIGCKVSLLSNPTVFDGSAYVEFPIDLNVENTLQQWGYSTITNNILLNNGFQGNDLQSTPLNLNYNNVVIRFTKKDGSYFDAQIEDEETGTIYNNDRKAFKIKLVTNNEVGLGWSNCFTFGNGIESNRIRDDFNKPQIANGVKASISLDQEYKEENRKNGLIFSGIYNSNTGINNLNQFIMADKITKDLNPTYGSIQKLFQRRISLVSFCEDRVVSIISNKDALYNADGNVQLVSSNNVLGDATPFVGDFGISKNPESFAKESYRAYFADKQRGAVLRLSMDGLTPISDAGMDDFFRDNLKTAGEITGGFDAHSKNYNITLSTQRPSENFIVNSYLQEGEDTTGPSANPQLVTDGDPLSSIVNVTYPTIDIANNLTNNRVLNFWIEIINHDAIPAGSLEDETETITTQQLTSTSFVQDQDPNSLASWNFINAASSPVFGPLGHFGGATTPDPDKAWQIKKNIASDFVTDSEAGTVDFYPDWDPSTMTFPRSNSSQWYGAFPSPARAGVSRDIIWNPDKDHYSTVYSHTYADSTGGYVSPVLGSGTTANPWFFTDNNSLGHGRGLCWDGTQGALAIFPGVKVNSNNVITPTLVLDKYPNAAPNTIFNGEEVRIQFFARNYNQVNDDGTQGEQGSGTTADHHRYITLQLFDGVPGSGGVVLSDEVIFDGSNPPPNTSGDFGSTQSDPMPQNNYKLGFHSTSGADFGTLTSTGNVLHNIFFKFTNDTGTGNNDADNTEQIVVQDLQVGIRFFDENGVASKPAFGAISSLNIKKTLQMSDVDTFQTITTQNGDAMPPVAIPAWAEVKRLGPNTGYYNWDFSVNGFSLPEDGFATESLALYGVNYIAIQNSGIQDDGNVVTWLESPDGGVSNGTVNYQDYSDGVIGTNDVIEVTGSGGNVIQIKQASTFVTGNYYVVDLTLRQGTPTGDVPFISHNVSGVPTNFNFVEQQVKFDFSGVLHGAYRCIFQGDNANSELAINIPANLVATIHSINMLDVSETWSGGTATHWIFNHGSSNNPNPTTSFDIPLIFPSSNGIEFNNSTSNGTQFYLQAHQPINGLIPTNDGYELTFNVTNYVEGAGSFRVIGDGVDNNNHANVGQWGDNVIDQDGSYKIEFNMDSGSYDVYIDGVDSGHDTQDVVNIGTNQQNRIIFGDGAGFIGAINNISLKDITTYFTPGSVGNFIISGFDPNVNDYITFDSTNENIEFINAPITGDNGPVQISQQLNIEPSINDTFRVKFHHVITTGSISGYYFNNLGEGFRFQSAITGIDTYDVLHTVGDDSHAAGELLETFVILVDTDNTNGTIDNILFRKEYELIDEKTVSFDESVRGWTSFKSFIPEQSTSLMGNYYTFKNGGMFKHNEKILVNDIDTNRNIFYGVPYPSTITAILNESPSVVKSFNTLNYEGSQSKVQAGDPNVLEKGNYYNTLKTYNSTDKDGWSVEYIKTDKQEGNVIEFIEKEGKWFNYIKGDQTINTADSSFQGLGTAKEIITITP